MNYKIITLSDIPEEQFKDFPKLRFSIVKEEFHPWTHTHPIEPWLVEYLENKIEAEKKPEKKASLERKLKDMIDEGEFDPFIELVLMSAEDFEKGKKFIEDVGLKYTEQRSDIELCFTHPDAERRELSYLAVATGGGLSNVETHWIAPGMDIYYVQLSVKLKGYKKREYIRRLACGECIRDLDRLYEDLKSWINPDFPYEIESTRLLKPRLCWRER